MRCNCVVIVQENWVKLKTHFSFAIHKEKCFSAGLFHDMLQDNTNYVYLKMLKPILIEVQRVNLLFQRDLIDLCRLYDNINGLIMFFLFGYTTSIR